MLPEMIRRLFRVDRGHASVEADLDTELRFHLDTKVEALVAAGMSREEARDEALRQFGDLRRARRELAAIDYGQTARRLRKDALESWWQDFRYAARGLARAPGFTAVVVITLAVGLGATAAMFGVLDRLLLRAPIGVGDPSHVARLYVRQFDPRTKGPRLRSSFRYPELEAFAGAPSVVAVALYAQPQPVPLRDAGGTAQVRAALVSGDYFKALGVRPDRGRMFLASDDSAGSAAVTVISHGAWTSRYGAESSIVGRVIQIQGRAYTVVGVAPKGFSGLSPQTVDLWLPIAVAADDLFGVSGLRRRAGAWDWRVGAFIFGAVAREAGEVNPSRVGSELTLAFRRHQAAQPAVPFAPADTQATVVLGSIIPGRSQLELGQLGGSLSLSLLVSVVALIVCLIAIANVANLLLLRALGRRRETGIRIALGVSRWRLVRAVLAESLLLAGAAGALAAVVASLGGELLRKLLVQADWAEPLAGGRLFGFVALAAFIVGVVTSLVPALLGAHPDVLASLKAGVRLGGWKRSRVRGALLMGQVALTLVLVAGLGLFARSLLKASRVDLGLDADHLLVADLSRGSAQPPSVGAREVVERLRSLPGVRAAAWESEGVPMYSFGIRYVRAEGIPSLPNNSAEGGPFIAQIGEGYLTASGLAFLRGRRFDPADFTYPPTVAFVNDVMARRLWPAGDAIGKCLYVQLDKTPPPCSRIVGIVGNARQRLTEPPPMQYYLPLATAHEESRQFVVRSVGDPQSLVRSVRDLLATVRPDLPDDAVRTVGSLLEPEFRPWRVATVLFATFAGLGLLVAVVGLYSVVAFDGTQRTHEFGIRMALGASGWDLAGLLLRQAVRYAALGAVLGIVLALVAGRLIAKELFDTTPRDPVVLAGAGLLLLISAVAACVLPARTAATVDPRISLQAD